MSASMRSSRGDAGQPFAPAGKVFKELGIDSQTRPPRVASAPPRRCRFRRRVNRHRLSHSFARTSNEVDIASAVLEVVLQRVGRVAQILATDDDDDGRGELEESFGDHLEFVIDSRVVSSVSELEAVAAAEDSGEGDDANLLVALELTQFLDNGSEAVQLPLETRAVADVTVAQHAGGSNGRVPGREVTAVDDGSEDIVYWPFDDLAACDEGHRRVSARG